MIAGIVTQGRPQRYNQWVRTYKVSCGDNATQLSVIEENGLEKVFQGNRDYETKVYNELPEILSCKIIRIYPQTWNSHISMRVEFISAIPLNVTTATTVQASNIWPTSAMATHPMTRQSYTTTPGIVCYMGMMSRVIPNSAITASTFWGREHEPYRARLDNLRRKGSRGSWSSRVNKVGQWLQVDFRVVKQVAGIITQGRPKEYDQWVRSFKIKCGATTKSLVTVQENGRDKIFRGNSDRDTKVYNRFSEVLSCRFIRIYPQTWNNHMSMRMEFVSGRCFNNQALWSTRCRSTDFMFTKVNHTDYIKYKGSIPRMTSYTSCAWLTPFNSTTPINGVLLSYCKFLASGCNTMQIKFSPSDRTVRVINNGQKVTWTNVSPIANRSHVCFVLSQSTKMMHYYVNGVQRYPAQRHAQTIAGGGVLIIGQDQDGMSLLGKVGTPQHPEEGFTGNIEDVLLWNTALSPGRIQNLYNSGCNCVNDATVTFTSATSVKEGHVIPYFNQTCHENSNL